MRLTSCLLNVAKNIVFNKNIRIKHLDRASKDKDAHIYDYVKDHVAKDICDRIDDLTFKEKRRILNIGSCSGLVIKNLNPTRVQSLTQADISSESLNRCKNLTGSLPPSFPVNYVHCDEEDLPFDSESMDLVMSCLDLHWVNDLVTCFNKTRQILKKDCPFIGVLFGGDTLFELRSSLQLAELERLQGFSSHVSPKTTGQDIARLLQASGFQMITVDISSVKIMYPSMFELMFDLQGMGENNSSLIGCNHMHRDVLIAASSIYQSLYGDEKTEGVPATFQMIHFVGWRDPTQATPITTQ